MFFGPFIMDNNFRVKLCYILNTGSDTGDVFCDLYTKYKKTKRKKIKIKKKKKKKIKIDKRKRYKIWVSIYLIII